LGFLSEKVSANIASYENIVGWNISIKLRCYSYFLYSCFPLAELLLPSYIHTYLS
jgi:hypothetical protein